MPAKSNDNKPQESTPLAAARRPRSVWNEHAKRLFQAEMARHGVSYKQLARILKDDGRSDSDESLMTRINRGTFSLAFFLQVLRALGTNSVDISHIPRGVESRARSRK